MRLLLILFFLISGLDLYSQRRGDTVKLDMKMIAQNRIYDSNEVEELAHFPGGEVAWEKYLLTNLKYPKMPEKSRKIYFICNRKRWQDNRCSNNLSMMKQHCDY
jgi:hypothetical protein